MKEITRGWILKRTFLILLLLISPFLESIFVGTKDRYMIGSTVSEVMEKLSYIGRKTFTSDKPIDILFVGHSGMWVSVNARMLEDGLKHVTGNNDIVVENFGHHSVGVDADYFLIRDIVAQRRVKAIILGLEGENQEETHRYVRYIWDPIKYPIDSDIFPILYSEKVLDSLATVVKSFGKKEFRATPWIEPANGGNRVPMGFSGDDDQEHLRRPFVIKHTQPKSFQLKDITLSPESMVIVGKHSSYEEKFYRKIIEFTKEHNIDLYFMHPPVLHLQTPPSQIEVLSLSENLGEGIPVLGVPVTRLLGTSSKEEMHDYFYNHNHVNMNGAELFSASIFPAILEIYEKTNR